MPEVKIISGAEELALDAEEGRNLLSLLQENNLEVDAVCGGQGRCGKCKVRVKGAASELTIKERDLLSQLERERGVRLACEVEVEGAIEVGLLSEGDDETLRILDEGVAEELTPQASIEKDYLELEEPTLEDQASDWTRIIRELDRELEINLDLLQQLPDILREAGYNITVVRAGNQVLQIEPGNTTDSLYGLAFDIGTTTVVGFLLDLNTGKQIGKVAMANAQKTYGADALSRVNYTVEENEGALDLQEKIIRTINQIIEQIIDKYGVNRDRIYELVFVGNTIMNHLLLGLKTEYLAKAPYIAVINEPQSIPAQKLGIELLDDAVITYLPNVASYVGSDIVSGLLTTNLNQTTDYKLLVDLGTNSELVLGNNDQMLACAAAAGPAFEGAEIEFGMNGIDGAIEEVRITDQLEINIIGDKPAKGICGSGIISLLAELKSTGMMDESGKLLSKEELPESVPAEIKEGLIEDDTNKKLILVDEADAANGPVTISQKDIRAVQLAKGAIRAGIKILLKEMELEISDLDEVLIAGGFGNYIKPKDAVTIGVLPTASDLEIYGIGNAAGSGAKAVLLNRGQRDKAEEIAKEVDYLELSGRQDFQTEFMGSMAFKKFE